MDQLVAELALDAGVNGNVQWRRRSNYAVVMGVLFEHGPRVIKLPVPWYLAELGDTDREAAAADINQVTLRFRAALAERAACVAGYSAAITRNGFPVHDIEDISPDCERMLRSDLSLAPRVLRAIVANAAGVIEGDDRAVGMDLRLSNFGMRGDRAVYFDLFPALVRLDGTYHVHYPNPTDELAVAREVERKFDPFGMIRRLRFDAMAIDAGVESAFMAALSELPAVIRARVEAQFASLPDADILGRTPEEIEKCLDNLPDDDVETRREIAVRLIALRGAARREVLDEIFQVTSLVVCHSVADRQQNLERYRTILRRYL